MPRNNKVWKSGSGKMFNALFIRGYQYSYTSDDGISYYDFKEELLLLIKIVQVPR